MSTGKLKAFYNSDRWAVCRQMLIQSELDKAPDGVLRCSVCGKALMDKGDVIVHHTPVELTEDNVDDVMVSLNPENLAIVCFKCHNKAHDRWCGTRRPCHKRMERGVYIVYGPPLSGKSSYVRENMEEGDIAADMDMLYAAVSGLQMYNKPDRLITCVMDLRDKLIEDIRYRRGGWRAAWIVGGYPSRPQREKLAADTGGELIFLDTPKEECYARLAQCHDYRAAHADEWRGYIDDWFDRYSV